MSSVESRTNTSGLVVLHKHNFESRLVCDKLWRTVAKSMQPPKVGSPDWLKSTGPFPKTGNGFHNSALGTLLWSGDFSFQLREEPSSRDLDPDRTSSRARARTLSRRLTSTRVNQKRRLAPRATRNPSDAHAQKNRTLNAHWRMEISTVTVKQPIRAQNLVMLKSCWSV